MKASPAVIDPTLTQSITTNNDRFHADLWVSGHCANLTQTWAFVAAVWAVSERALRRKATGWSIESDWAWGGESRISVKRSTIDALEKACRSYEVAPDLVLLGNRVWSEVGVTGITLVTNGARAGGAALVDLLISVRGTSRVDVSMVAKHVIAKIEDSRRIFESLGDRHPVVSSEDLGVMTTLSLGNLFSPTPPDPSSTPYLDTASGWVTLPSLIARITQRGASVSIGMLDAAGIIAPPSSVEIAPKPKPVVLKGWDWVKDQWRNQTTTFILTIIAGVLTAALVTLLRLTA